LGPKSHFRIGRLDNKEKRLFYFGLMILLPIQIQVLEIENTKNLKIDSPNVESACRTPAKGVFDTLNYQN
jgi:hypothetical protein